MMIPQDLLDILCCPDCRQDLTLDAAALVCAPCGSSFPIVDGIPVFVDKEKLNSEKMILSDFYENFGWQKSENEDIYKTQAVFGYESDCMTEYRVRSNKRLIPLFDPTGKYFVDCASGAVAATEYLEYSKGYQYHVCVDLTLLALMGAREKLGEKGLYINADATKLPIKADVVDQILSSQTLFHVPKDEQVDVVKEFQRVLKPRGQCVILYNLGRHSLAGKLLAPYFWFRRRRENGVVPQIYSYHFTQDWFNQFSGIFSSTKFYVYRFLPNQVIKHLFPNNAVSKLMGRALISIMSVIEKMHFLSSMSQFITVVFRK